jgi:hypothetical protein
MTKKNKTDPFPFLLSENIGCRLPNPITRPTSAVSSSLQLARRQQFGKTCKNISVFRFCRPRAKTKISLQAALEMNFF